jgi:DNA-directed RNA polymerase specialized sigma24 family protein
MGSFEERMATLHNALNNHFSRLPFAPAYHIEVLPALLDSLAQSLASMPELDFIIEDSSRKASLLKHEIEVFLPTLYNGAAAALLAELPTIIMRISVTGGEPESPDGISDLAVEQSSAGAEGIAVQLAAIPGLGSFLRNALQALQLPELDNALILRLAAATVLDYVNAVLGIYGGASSCRKGLERYFAKRIRCLQTVDRLVSDTFLRAILAIRDGRPPIMPATWLRTLARKVIASHLEERGRHSFSQITEDTETAVTYDLSSRIVLRELIKTVKHDVGKKEALACRLKLRGFTDEEVGVRLNCDKKTVARKMKRVLKFAGRKWGIVPAPEYGRRRRRGRACRPASKASA